MFQGSRLFPGMFWDQWCRILLRIVDETTRNVRKARTEELPLVIHVSPLNIRADERFNTRPTHELCNAGTEGLHCVHDARPENDVIKAIDIIPLDFASHYVQLQIDGEVDKRHSHVSQ